MHTPSCPAIADSKNGVASLAYVPGIHVLLGAAKRKDVDGRVKPGHDDCGVHSALPLPMGERVGVRGLRRCGLTCSARTPSPSLRSTSPPRGEVKSLPRYRGGG